MFDNLMLIVVLVTVLWLGAFVYYFMLSRQQEDIAETIDQIQQKLGPEEADGE